jgi:FkbM family methyltransferase
MQNKLVFKISDILFKNAFPIYKPLYFSFKKKQDAEEILLLNKLVKPGYIVLDIGGNIGFYSVILAQLVGNNGHVHVFEPDRNNFKHLKKLTKKLQNTTVNNMAVADKKGELKLYVSDMLNVDHRTYAHDGATDSYTVLADSIDNYVASKFKVDFIKMDIQGAEMHAFNGMINTIKENPDLKIITELWAYGLRSSNTDIQDLFSFFTNHSLNVYLIEKGNVIEFPMERLDTYKNYGEFDFDNILLTKTEIY